MLSTATLAIVAAVLATLGVAGILYTIIAPMLERRRQAARRLGRAAGGRGRVAGGGKAPADSSAQRRRQVQEALKQLEAAHAKRRRRETLHIRIEQAGLDVSMRSFWMASAGLGLAVGLVVLLVGQMPLVAVLAGFSAGFGVPRWVLGYLKRRRVRQFTEEFANAVDVIVRGLKAGLPLHDCIQIIATESSAPVRDEFKVLMEAQRVGITLEEGLQRMCQRVPSPDLNFFQIVLSIQQRTGGNLSEALGNLSKVLRSRKVLKGKIAAMSQEAKSSAAIIGALPPGVMLLVYVTTPDYISLLFEERLGQAMLIGGGLWMLLGILVMKKMINFDY